jgi:pepF/M3 family oligoendopeptidase
MTTTVEPAPRLPRWEVASFFPSLDSRELHAAHEGVTADLARLEALYDRHDVRDGPRVAPTLADHEAVAEVLAATNTLMEQVRLVNAYLYAHVSTDARDDAASGLQSQLQQELAPLTRLTKRFEAWTARFGAEALTQGPGATDVAAGHAFAIAKAAASAEHQMSEAEEGLAADLRLSGSSAWARLHRDLTARLTADVDGAVLPMSVVRGMAHDPDAGVRRRAYDAELVAWEGAAVPLAAALNGAKGEAVVVNTRRGWRDALEPALFTNNVDRATLDAMTEAVVASLPHFRRFMHAKAQLLGHEAGRGLPWWDQVAPVAARGGRAPTFDWTAATNHVREAFASFSPSLEALASRAIDDAWIDAEPRDGKVGGAFCLPVRGGESRVLLNFDGSFDSVQTLAHELGHAYHNTNLGERSPLQRQTPMALAETASIFCETIVVAAGLADADDAGRLVLLNTDLQGAAQVVVDIHSRFLFESELCRRRATRTLSIPELNEMMLDAQRQAYGDGLDGDAMHPYMWAVKGHYFTPFYNWPYTFGLLFGIGLYARYLDDPDRFRQGYDDLLSSTGLGDAASLAARFDIDVRSTAFWSSSLDVLRGRIDDFVSIVDAESRR